VRISEADRSPQNSCATCVMRVFMSVNESGLVYCGWGAGRKRYGTVSRPASHIDDVHAAARMVRKKSMHTIVRAHQLDHVIQ
jgi:hypothetical protein